MDLIPTMEKTLNDLTELESNESIKNSLDIRSIENRMPDKIKED